MSAPNWSQPGLFTSAQDVAGIQRTAARWAAAEDDPQQARENQREIRYRLLVKSAVLWAVIGIPLGAAALTVVTQWLAVFFGAVAQVSGQP